MSDESPNSDFRHAQTNPSGQAQASGAQEAAIDDDLHSYIEDLEEKVASSRTAKELIKAFKEVLTSPNAPKIAEAIGSQLVKAKEVEATARASAAKSYGTSAIVGNIGFVCSLVLCLAFLAWVIHTLKSDKDLLLPVLSAVISLIAGAGGGYIFGRQSVPKK